MPFLLILFLIGNFCLFADFHMNTEIDLRWKYQDLGPRTSAQVLIARFDKVFSLPFERELYLRLDVPYMWLKSRERELIEVDEEGIVSTTDEHFHNLRRVVTTHHHIKENGLSDILTKAFIVLPFPHHMHLGLGSDFMFPTATARAIGTGKYRARPTIGIEWGNTWFWTALLARYEFSYAGQSHRPSIRIFYIQPVLFFDLPQNWCFAFAPESQYNCKTDQWFVPFTVFAAKGIGNHFYSSIEYKVGLVIDFPVYRQEVEVTFCYVF